MNRFVSLTSRLVLAAVLLVTMASLLIGSATIVALRASLNSQLDAEVESSLDRGTPPVYPGPRDGVGDGKGRGFRADNDGGDHGSGRDSGGFDDGNFAPGTLQATLGQTPTGVIIGLRDEDQRTLSASTLAQLDSVRLDGQAHPIQLDGYGAYRVAGRATGASSALVAGLPTRAIDETVGALIAWELLLTALGVGAATGLGLFVVRRQMQPLHEVAATAHTVSELPLAQGEIDLSARVPHHLTDERTEVGQVGSALNRLLEHVESSLHARHRSEQQVRQFVADASHELRTPLATIVGYTEFASNRPDDLESARLALSKVEGESARMTALVEDLLLLARLDSGRPLAREVVDVTRLLLEAVADAQVVSPGHHWRLDLPPEAIELNGDEARLHQAVTNLLTNAQKYTPVGSTVTVSASREGQTTTLSVHDDGPGFEPDIATEAFSRFVRGDAARTRATSGKDSGAGLGLALVKAIIEEHGGSVSLTSQPGDTLIVMSLPDRPQHP